VWQEVQNKKIDVQARLCKKQDLISKITTAKSAEGIAQGAQGAPA
jgi:hypothetical protein